MSRHDDYEDQKEADAEEAHDSREFRRKFHKAPWPWDREEPQAHEKGGEENS